MKLFALLGLAVAVMSVQWSRADEYHFGSCPKVDPVPQFDFDKMAGLWYVIERIDSSSRCWTYFFFTKNGTRKAVISQNQIVDAADPENTAGSIATFESPYPTNPGVQHVRYSDNIAGKSDFTFFFSDYTSYAAAYKCQKILVGYRESAVILSRTPYLSQSYTNQARAKLVGKQISIQAFNRIDQSACRYTPGINVTLNGTRFLEGMDFGMME